jgi:hypothetical protein
MPEAKRVLCLQEDQTFRRPRSWNVRVRYAILVWGSRSDHRGRHLPPFALIRCPLCGGAEFYRALAVPPGPRLLVWLAGRGAYPIEVTLYRASPGGKQHPFVTQRRRGQWAALCRSLKARRWAAGIPRV